VTVHEVVPGETRIGWIGTGVMGRSMCGHLIDAGFSLTIHNRTRQKAEELLARGAAWAETPKAVAETSDVVFAIVGYPADVRSVFLDEDGVLAGCKPGSIVVDMTTSQPSLAMEIAEAARKIGAYGIDAMGKTVVHQGPPGAGQHTKMVNQVLLATNMIGVCEGLLYAHKAGLDLETAMRSVASGAAGSWSLSNLGPRIIAGDFAPGFYVEHFLKDLGIALEESRRMGLSMPGLALAEQLYLALKSQGHGRDGTHALHLALAEMSGVEWKGR
jgi:3-hydroxyisobutyrate dehydrogenase